MCRSLVLERLAKTQVLCHWSSGLGVPHHLAVGSRSWRPFDSLAGFDFESAPELGERLVVVSDAAFKQAISAESFEVQASTQPVYTTSHHRCLVRYSWR